MKNKKEDESELLNTTTVPEEDLIDKKESYLICKVLKWNKHTKVVVIDFENTEIQMKSKVDLSGLAFVKVVRHGELFEII